MTQTQALSNRAFLAAILFGCLLMCYEEVQSLRHVSYLFSLSTFGSLPLRLLGITQILLSLFLVVGFAWLSFTATYRWRILYFCLLAAILVVQYSYDHLFNRFMTIRDLYTALASPLGLWVDSASFVSPKSVLPLLVYAGLLWWTRRETQTGGQGLTAVLLTLFLAGGLIFITDQRYLGLHLGNNLYRESPALSLPALFRTLAATALSEAQSAPLARQMLVYEATSSPSNNIVFVIDESMRGDHLGLNGYERDTTPYLDDLAAQGLMINWGIASAAATSSVESNRVLINGLAQLPDNDFLHEQYPTIFQYAKAMGYTTYHIDTQTNYLWNGLTLQDYQRDVDHWINTNDLGASRQSSDFLAAERAYEVINQSIGNFIVLNKTGVHFHFNDKYPAETAVWQPIPPTGDYSRTDLTTNTYDNAIHYNLNGFWQRLIPNSAAINNTLFLYTSDHGVTLGENGEWWIHGGSSQQEVRVPLLLIGNNLPAVDTAYNASHYNLFATLLDLFAFPPAERLHAYPPSLLKATATDSTDRYYLGGQDELIRFEAPK